MFQSFNMNKNNQLHENMFFGQNVNVARYDQQRHDFLADATDQQLAQFWRPEEVDLAQDRIDFLNLPEHEKHIFISNLKYQTLLDSIQGRCPAVAFLPIVSTPECEVWSLTWAFFESIHSRSYTHIIRNVVNDPSEIFDDIVVNEFIQRRTADVAKYYDDLIEYSGWYTLLGEGSHVVNGKDVDINLRELKKKLYLCLISVNALEAVRFYVSFACTFAFAEREVLEGNAKLVKLISRDENLHMRATQDMINALRNGRDDMDFISIAMECEDEAVGIFRDVAEQEKDWVKYLFKDGAMIGLNTDILSGYVEFITNVRMSGIGLTPIYENVDNPIPWINSWLTSDNVQVAPQEAEISSYLVGQIDSEVDKGALSEMSLG